METAHVLKVSENSPYIDITIGTHQFRTLLDTGSQRSLVSEDYVKLLEPKFVKTTQTENIALISATGHKLKVARSVRIRITLGKVRMFHDFIVVSDLNHDMILGIDFLNARKAHLDFEHQTLIIGKTVHPLKQKLGQSQVKPDICLV